LGRALPAKRSAERQTIEDSQASRKVKANKIIVVAFGDSLTAGDQPPRPGAPLPKSTPYTDPLKELIDRALGKIGKLKLVRVIIYNKGVSGETTSDMMRRLDSDVLVVKPSYTIVLGGSNDIGWGVEPREISDNLVQMYEKLSSKGIEVVACTIPSIVGADTCVKPRLELNEFISDYCFENELVCVDLFSATVDPKTKMLDKKYSSSDGLHLSTAGYTKVAETIFEQAFAKLVPIWTVGQETLGSSTKPR
jgi:acyl-CoA thioesterase-1